MSMQTDKYCGDAEMKRLLKKVDSKLSLPEIYGLLYGCHAAPYILKPSSFASLVFGEDAAEFRSRKEADNAIGNLMFLWNALVGWNAEKDPFFYPDINYPDNLEGLMQQVKDDLSLVKFFIKGLDLGEAAKDDFSKDAANALKSLSEADAFLARFIEVFQKHSSIKDEEFKKAKESIVDLEGIVGGCIARINLGLREARKRVVKEIHASAGSQKKTQQAKSEKIPRNEPCPCGSGIKYKKCCGSED